MFKQQFCLNNINLNAIVAQYTDTLNFNVVHTINPNWRTILCVNVF